MLLFTTASHDLGVPVVIDALPCPTDRRPKDPLPGVPMSASPCQETARLGRDGGVRPLVPGSSRRVSPHDPADGAVPLSLGWYVRSPTRDSTVGALYRTV